MGGRIERSYFPEKDIVMKLKTGCLLLMLILFFGGCQPGNKVNQSSSAIPDYIVGIWEADRLGWAFKIEKDGSINRLKHMLAGTMSSEEGGKYVEGQDEGTYANFVLGECKGTFDPETHELEIKLSLDYFDMVLPIGRIQGRVDDYFNAKVEPGQESFKAKWRSYSWLDGADPPDKQVIDANPETLTFTKVDLDTNN